jgi:hypothetical protein
MKILHSTESKYHPRSGKYVDVYYSDVTFTPILRKYSLYLGRYATMGCVPNKVVHV